MVCGPDGEMDETKTAYFNQKWFYDFQNLALDSIFWGFSCVQFGAIVNDRYTSVVCFHNRYKIHFERFEYFP